jgi:hypothetical protein
MDKRYFASLAVRVALAVALSALLSAGQAPGKDASAGTAIDRGKGKKTGQLTGQPPGWKRGKKQGWETELPPGWKTWDDAKRKQWKHGLDRAKKAVRKHAETRLNASLRALEAAARKGVPLYHAEKMAKAGLDDGLGPFDFEPLGKFVVERVKAGVKGEGLSKVIHEELNRRRQQREMLRKKMNQKNRQRYEEHNRLRKELKQKKQLGKPRKGKSLEKLMKEREKGISKHRLPSTPRQIKAKRKRQ